MTISELDCEGPRPLTDIMRERIAELETTIERIRATIEVGPGWEEKCRSFPPPTDANTSAAWQACHAWAKRVVAETLEAR